MAPRSEGNTDKVRREREDQAWSKLGQVISEENLVKSITTAVGNNTIQPDQLNAIIEIVQQMVGAAVGQLTVELNEKLDVYNSTINMLKNQIHIKDDDKPGEKIFLKEYVNRKVTAFKVAARTVIAVCGVLSLIVALIALAG